MQALWQTIRSDWNVMRIIRLGMGIFILVQAWQVRDYTFAVAGGLFSVLALLNLGCCATGNCGYQAPRSNTSQPNAAKEPIYEEVD